MSLLLKSDEKDQACSSKSKGMLSILKGFTWKQMHFAPQYSLPLKNSGLNVRTLILSGMDQGKTPCTSRTPTLPSQEVEKDRTSRMNGWQYFLHEQLVRIFEFCI